MDFLERMKSIRPGLALEKDVSMAKYTTLRVGGPADYWAEPADENELILLLEEAKKTDTPVLLMGNGSNLLVRDGGVRGLVIRLGRAFSAIERTGKGLRAQAGALLSTLARAAQEESLTGLEFAQGIPGTVGGGVYMNAGAYGGEMKQIVRSVRVLAGENVLEIDGESMDFSYRHSRAMEKGWMILGAEFSLAPGNRDDIDAAMRDYAARRKEKQPLEYPSAGSFFKRPQGHFAGALIEQAGLKGCRAGGAQVSEKHAGFLINAGGASAADFLALKQKVQDTVWEKFRVRLEPEVRIVGEEA